MNNFKKNGSSVIYVNFVPYENAGNIFTYILNRYETVISFIFNFHKVSETQKKSMLTIYKNKRVVYSCRLFQTPTNAPIAFLLLPIRSLVILAQLLYHLIRLNKKFGPYNTYFTVNALTAWAGNMLRKLKIVKYTVFWIWDYYPPHHENIVVRFMRYLYWQFDKPASRDSNRIILLNKRLGLLREKMGIFTRLSKFNIVGIGTNPIKASVKKSTRNPVIVFFGVLKKSQGLELFFSNAFSIHKAYPTLSLHIIGGGPDENYYRKLANTCPVPTVFHGYIEDDNTINIILSSCHIGLALYVPDRNNVAYYSDPSKIKRYLEVGLPVITTNVFSFSKEIASEKSGVIIPYKGKDLSHAIKAILKRYPRYQNNALRLAKKYTYRTIYSSMFSN